MNDVEGGHDDRRRNRRDHDGAGRAPDGLVKFDDKTPDVAFEPEFIERLKEIFEERIVFNQVLLSLIHI